MKMAVAVVGMSRVALNYWHSQGLGPPSLRLDGVRIYTRSDLLEWKAALPGVIKQRKIEGYKRKSATSRARYEAVRGVTPGGKRVRD